MTTFGLPSRFSSMTTRVFSSDSSRIARDVGQHLLVHQVGDALDQRRAVHVVGNLGDDDLLAIALQFLDAGLAAHLHAAAAGLEILLDARDAAESRSRSGNPGLSRYFISSSSVMSGSSICAQMPSITSPRLCGGMFVAMPTAMPVPPLTSRFGNAAGKTVGSVRRLVVVRDEVDRVLVHVVHERGAEMRHARLGVTHGRRRIAFDGTEVSLAIDERLAHRPGLRHVHERRVNHRFAVRVIVTARVAADLRALPMLPIREEREIVHRVEDAALRRLQSVARIRQARAR